MIRSAYFTESAVSEPPKPRLMILRSGNASVDFHIRIEELPTKTISFWGGGLALSCASKAAMSFSHLSWARTTRRARAARMRIVFSPVDMVRRAVRSFSLTLSGIARTMGPRDGLPLLAHPRIRDGLRAGRDARR